jgi:hypothetical protein
MSCKPFYLGVLVKPPVEGVGGESNGIPGDVAWAYLDENLTPPHELGHLMGRVHTLYRGDEACEGGTCPDYGTNGTISLSKDNANIDTFFGFDVINSKVKGPDTPDLMSYGPHRWPADYTYNGIRHFLNPAFTASSTTSPLTRHEVNLQPGITVGGAAVVISGSVSFSQATGNIGSVYTLNSTVGSLPTPQPGTYSLRFEDSQGQALATNSFEPDRGTEGSLSSGLFTLALPWNTNTARIILLHNNQEIATRRASAHSPLVRSTIAGTNQGLIRVLASDGFNTTQDQSDAVFSVAKHAPQANIEAPENSRLYVGDQTIILRGSAYDNEDGLLSDTTLSWSSNLNGDLGNGHALAINASSLAEGSHTITLTARDSDNQTNTATISIRISRARPVLPASLSIAPQAMNFVGKVGGLTHAQTIAIRNGGDGSLNWSATTDQSWIRLSSINGVTPINLSVSADSTELTSGQYTGHITIAADGAANTPQTIDVGVTVTPASTQVCVGDLNLDGIVDTADLAIVRSAFGSRCGTSDYKAVADVNHDCVVDVNDLAIVSRDLGCRWTPPHISISGHVADGTGTGVNNVTLTLNGSQSATMQTDGSGAYSFPNLSTGNYTVTPLLTGFTFTPASLSFANLDGDQTANFTGVPSTFSVGGKVTFGNVGLGGVTITVGGSQSRTTTTDVGGNYLTPNLLAVGNYTITPFKPNYNFTPQNQTLNNPNGNQAANFTATVTPGVPILISEETSTRAIALDSVLWLHDPFQLNYSTLWGVDRRTRVTLFAMNFDLLSGENISSVTAAAEDASHRIYPLTVEYVGKAAGFDWLRYVVIRLNDEMGDLGDVLVRINVHGVPSNRVRLGVGHNGGGPPDDTWAVPTPGRQP